MDTRKEHESSPWAYGGRLDFAGALVLGFDGRSVEEAHRLTHKEWRESTCGANAYSPIMWWSGVNASLDIQRAVLVDGVPYTFSRFGVMKYDHNFEVDKKLAYQNTSAANLCSFRF